MKFGFALHPQTYLSKFFLGTGDLLIAYKQQAELTNMINTEFLKSKIFEMLQAHRPYYWHGVGIPVVAQNNPLGRLKEGACSTIILANTAPSYPRGYKLFGEFEHIFQYTSLPHSVTEKLP